MTKKTAPKPSPLYDHLYDTIFGRYEIQYLDVDLDPSPTERAAHPNEATVGRIGDIARSIALQDPNNPIHIHGLNNYHPLLGEIAHAIIQKR